MFTSPGCTGNRFDGSGSTTVRASCLRRCLTYRDQAYYLRMHEDTQEPRLEVGSHDVDMAVEVFALLADPTRVRIILALRDEELSVNHLADIVDKSPTSVSQHLAKLRWGRIVQTRQDGNRVFYSLVDEHARTLVTQAVYQAQHAVDDVPAHHRARMTP